MKNKMTVTFLNGKRFTGTLDDIQDQAKKLGIGYRVDGNDSDYGRAINFARAVAFAKVVFPGKCGK